MAGAQSGTGILWFKRDLRAADHPALARAAESGLPIPPPFIVEPEFWAQQDASGRLVNDRVLRRRTPADDRQGSFGF